MPGYGMMKLSTLYMYCWGEQAVESTDPAPMKEDGAQAEVAVAWSCISCC